MSFIANAAAGAATGILTGFGVGGGTLLMVYITQFTEIGHSAARGINLMYFLPTAGASLFRHVREGRVVKDAFLLSASAGTVCAVLSAFVAGMIDPEPARRLFGVFLIITGISEVFRKNTKEASR